MDYPEFPLHPEPRSFAWSKLEIACIENYAKACVDADRAQRAAPGVQGGSARQFVEWIKAQPEDREPSTLLETLAEFEAAQPPQQSAHPAAYRAWFDADNGARWLFTLWPDEEKLEVDWQPLYAAAQPVEAQPDETNRELKTIARALRQDSVKAKNAYDGMQALAEQLEIIAFRDAAAQPVEAQRVPLTPARKNDMRVEYVTAQPEDAARAYYSFIAGIEWAEREHGIKPTSSEGGA